MRYHTSILIFLVAFAVLSAIVSKPTKQVVAAKINSNSISLAQLDSMQHVTGILIPASVATTITTKQDFISYLIATVGSFLTVILMACLKYFLPQVFGNVNAK